MLTSHDNELLTRVGPGTPMGQVFRRFWLPALMPEELPDPDCAPVRVRLLGENLVAFRDSQDRIGFMQESCPHRGASMFFGRNEEGGLRCVYHGWKFDVTGACVDMPNEPAESNFKHKIRTTVYPGARYGGLIWVYMGGRPEAPGLPQLEWCQVPDDWRVVAKWEQNTNYAQALEGELDSSHVSFLHRWLSNEDTPGRVGRRQRSVGLTNRDGAPTLTVQETNYGLVSAARRDGEDGYYWRISHFLLPTFSLTPGSGRCWIPVDDDHTIAFSYTYSRTGPLPHEAREAWVAGAIGIPRLIPGTFVPLANKSNGYLLDRQMQRTKNYTGIYGVRDQDTAMTEGMGPIYDRSHEHLGTSDLSIIAMRRLMLRTAAQLAAGVEPHAATHPEAYRVRSLDLVDREANLGAFLSKYADDLRAPVR